MTKQNQFNTLFLVATLLFGVAQSAVFAHQGAQSAPDPWRAFQSQISNQNDASAARAAAFLIAHHPAIDASIDPDLLSENLHYALIAHREFPWSKNLPDELFLNDVLPYAVLDETRDHWRPALYKLACDIVKPAITATEAVQFLNRDLFTKINVRYGTARPKANQSPFESMKCGLASCTGLSILLVDACRAVGIPARIAGIASWTDREGNHAWVEIWDGTQWRFTGAAEYDANGLDRAWFTGPASTAIEGHELHAIWATSWQPTGHHFPLVWNLDDQSVPAVDVTSRYTHSTADASCPAEPLIHVRLWESRNGSRLAAHVKMLADTAVHESTTFADPDDVNRVAEFPDSSGHPLRFELVFNNETRIAWLPADHKSNQILDLYWNELSLSKTSAEIAADKLWQECVAAHHDERKTELDALTIHDGEFVLRLLRHDFGEAPPAGHSLYISLHGGGNAPPEVNDQQWANQIKLYKPAEGIYLARAPSDTWNLWHRPEIDRLFNRLIESAILVWNINPDRVYLLGYSAGGDGVYQLAPRMADRFAAASMMAGHPNDASPLSLRNLPFAIFAGGKDTAYNRNTVAAEWGKKLDELREKDPAGYPHEFHIYPECGHWMNGQDAEAIPWMASQSRNPWPHRIIWRQGNAPHSRFYWLAIPENEATPNRTITADIHDQTITLECTDECKVELLFSDELLDLDQPLRVIANGSALFEGRAIRSLDSISQSLADRIDPRSIATAKLTIQIPPPPQAP